LLSIKEVRELKEKNPSYECIKDKEEHDSSKDEENEEKVFGDLEFSFEEFQVSFKEGVESIVWFTDFLDQIFHSIDSSLHSDKEVDHGI